MLHWKDTAHPNRGHVQGVASDEPLTGWEILTQVFPSALHLLDNVKAAVSALSPLAGPKVAVLLRKTVSDLFQTYTSSIAAGFQRHQQTDGSFPYNLGGTTCLSLCLLMLHVDFVIGC